MKMWSILLALGVGVILGILWTVAMIPDATLRDVFGETAAVLNISGQLESMGRAFRGLLIALMWGIFGLVVLGIGLGIAKLFESMEKRDRT